MGKLIDAGQEATGFFAVGQFATGVIAIGQVATGVIAIGQLARGFIAIGQAGFGLYGMGMVSGGVFWAAPLGVGGRGWGGVLPLVPGLDAPVSLPELTSFDVIARGQAAEGWVRADYDRTPSGPSLSIAGRGLPVKVARRYLAAPMGRYDVVALVRREGNVFVTERMQRVPVRRQHRPGFWLFSAFRFAALVGLAVAFWLLAGIPVLNAIT